MKKIKNLGKRGLALFLALMMCVSLLNLTVFAAQGGGKTGEVVHGAFEADDEGNLTYSEDANDTVSTPGGKVTVSKTAVPVKCPDGNQFEVTLEVVTKDEISSTVVTPDAAVTLVIDLSGSMEYCAECGESKHGDGCKYHKSGKNADNSVTSEQNRLAAAKTSAKDFLDSLVNNTTQNSDGTTPGRYVSLVVFGEKAEVKANWTDIMSGTGLADLKTAIDGLTISKDDYANDTALGRGTNLEQGLSKANDQMKSAAVNNVAKENKFTVVLTDGKPTYSGWKSTTDWWGNIISWSVEHGDGKSSSKDICDATVTTANTLKGNSNAIYTVFYGNSSDTCYGSGNNKVTIDTFLRRFSNSVYSAANSGQLTSSFESISNTIALLTKAWEVTDPMGPGVTFNGVTGDQGINVASADAGVLTWKLREDTCKTKTENGVTTYTYTLKYRVTVDATGEDYDEDATHPLNGYTSLSYGFYKDGKLVDEYGKEKADQTKLDTIAFNVPGVKVERPERSWHIEYYQQQSAAAGDYANYTKVDETKPVTAKVQDKVILREKDVNYEYKYAGENYHWVKTENATLTVTADGANVIRVYYDRDEAHVTVKHWVITKTVSDENPDGVYTGPVLQDTDQYSTFVGETFSNAKYLELKKVDSQEVGETTYTSDNDKNIQLTKDNKDVTINLYYVKEEGERTKVTYDVNHYYREDSWKLDDVTGKYVPVTGEYEKDTGLSKSGMEGFLNDTAKANPETKNGEYALVASESTPELTIKLGETGNVINAYYFKARSETPAESATLTIEHKYYTVDNKGNVIATEGTWYELENETVYVGEFYRGTVTETYGGNTYTLKGISVPVEISEAGKEYTITLEYKRLAEPNATADVYHDYYTEVWTFDEETGTGEYVRNAEPDKTVHEADKYDHYVGYVGDRFTPVVKADSYEFVLSESAWGPQTLKEGNNKYRMVYVQYKGGPEDDTDESASVTVYHNYVDVTVYLDESGNVVKTVYSEPETVEGETVTGYPGETFKAETVEKGEYVFVSADTPNQIVTLRTLGGEYHLRYEHTTEVTPVPVTVHRIFKTDTISIDPETHETVHTVTDDDEQLDDVILTGPYYAGETVTVVPGDYNKPLFDNDVPVYHHDAEDGRNTTDATITVSEDGENIITLVYVQQVDARVPVAVAVRNHYTTLTKSMDDNGMYHEELTTTVADVAPVPVVYYVGQRISTVGMGTSKGYGVDTREGVTQPEDSIVLEEYTVLDFYWYKEEGDKQPTTVQVIHHYKIVDANPAVSDKEWTVGDKSEDVLQGYTVGWTYVASPNYADGQFDETNITSIDPVNAFEGIELVAGGNVIEIWYEKEIDTRPFTSVKVIHEYYASANATEPAFVDKAEFSKDSKGKDLRVGDEFTAVPVYDKNGVTYDIMVVDPALTIELGENTKDDEGNTVISNVITIKYVRAETTYQVIHEYYTNNSLTGSVEQTVGGTAGAVITADGIAKQTSYQGNTYTYRDSSGSLTLVQGENGAITLRYYRTTGTTTPTTYFTLTINYVDEDGNTVAATYTQRQASGWRYNVTSPAVEGMTPNRAVVSGTLTGNTTITVTYTAVEDVNEPETPLTEEPGEEDPGEEPYEEEDLGENDTPLGDLPSEEDLGETDIPLDDSPKTGDTAMLCVWSAVFMLSLAGLIVLFLSERRRTVR